MRSLPAFSAAAFMARASSAFMAIGFSQRTCLPALRAAMVQAAWALFQVQTLTASISGSAASILSLSSKTRSGGTLYFAAFSSARALLMSQRA